MSDGAFLAEGPFLVPCCGELGLDELFDVGGGRGREVRDKREVRGIFGKFVCQFIAAVSLVAGDPKKGDIDVGVGRKKFSDFDERGRDLFG